MSKIELILKPGYKNSPLGLIPEDWEIKKISEVGEVFSGGTPDTNNLVYWNGDINWCTPTDISALKGSKYLYGTTTKITKEGINKSSANILPINSIIVCTRATIGKAAINKQPMSTNQGFKNIIPNNIEHEYLYYTILSEEFGLKKIANGSTFLEVSKTDFDNYKILVPPINEQKLISNILINTDNLINQTQNLIKKFETRNKGLQQKMLTGKVRINGFTDKWKENRLSDIFNRITRKNNEEHTNVLTISAQRGLINQENYFNKQIASEILDNYYLLFKNEFAFNKSYSNGYPMGAIKRLKLYDKGVVTTLYICFKLKEESKYSLDFFEQYFENQLLVESLQKVAQEGGRAHGLLNITSSDFFGIKILIPDSKEQFEIAKILSKANEEVDLYKQKLEKLKQVKKGLMQQLLTGKTRVKI